MEIIDKETQKELIKNYVSPHKKISRDVLDTDIERVVKDAHIMYNLCFCLRGICFGGEAVAHSQINDKDPLNFFVTKNKKIVINPEITRHSNYTVEKIEGCLSFPDKRPINVNRWQKCDVKYATIGERDGQPIIIQNVVEKLSGKEAEVFQHEIDHCKGILIFNI